MKLNKALLATGLALFALVAHFAVPLAVVDDGFDKHTYWASNWSSDGPDSDPVPGASMTLLLVALLLTLVGTAGVWLLPMLPLRLAAGAVAAAGGGLSLLGHGLWGGRTVASLIHAILGSDGPQARTAGLSGDYFHYVWAIGPIFVVAAVAVAMWFMFDALASDAEHGRGAVRPAQWAAIGIIALAIMPWAIENGEDALPPVEGNKDQDPFMISGYDALRFHMDSQVVVEATGENGLSEYDNVRAAIGPWPFLLAGLGAIIGLAGIWRIDADDKIVGRGLLTAGAVVAIASAILSALSVVLVAVFLTNANEVVDARPAYAPLLAAVAFLLMMPPAIGVMRALGAAKDRLIADRFPEPIVYE